MMTEIAVQRWSFEFSDRIYTIVIERDADLGGYICHIPGWPGAHSRSETIAELQEHMAEVVAMLLEDGECAKRAGS